MWGRELRLHSHIYPFLLLEDRFFVAPINTPRCCSKSAGYIDFATKPQKRSA